MFESGPLLDRGKHLGICGIVVELGEEITSLVVSFSLGAFPLSAPPLRYLKPIYIILIIPLVLAFVESLRSEKKVQEGALRRKTGKGGKKRSC